MASDLKDVKIGVGILDYISDDICEYKSTLFKTSSTVKESFLQILYQYRKRWPKYTLMSLHALLTVCQCDKTGTVFNYLKTMDPPTYQYARYIDWIGPYIQD